LSDGPEEFRTSTASDIFSLAMTFFNVWELQVPFVKFSEQRPATHINVPSQMEEEFWQFIESMWAHAPSDRPSSEDVQKQLFLALYSSSAKQSHCDEATRIIQGSSVP
jgi:hypothetical protein